MKTFPATPEEGTTQQGFGSVLEGAVHTVAVRRDLRADEPLRHEPGVHLRDFLGNRPGS